MSLNLTVPFSSAVFGLGMLHAFDVDHIMAISGLAGSRPDSKKNVFALCALGVGSWIDFINCRHCRVSAGYVSSQWNG